jgi:hypothetical protein
MINRQLFFAMLVAGMSLATAWAIRGQFGHEQGAAWAGGIGGMALVVISGRKDWFQKAFQLSLASALGWGVGGVISYGMVVGYGRGTDFGNAYYGLTMLFVIGGLFGLLGGGLFGLVLADSPAKPIKWHRLIVEMGAGAFIFYHLIIDAFGWLMTPPRSEAWAACLGMAIAMFWFMIRHKHYSAMRVAIFAGFGGGFGFAFGNFMQVIGNALEIKFNFWNVMEYSIGFFGGAGMAYGTFTSEWEASDQPVPKNKIILPLVVLTLIIPFIVWDQSLKTERLSKVVQEISPLSDSIQLAHYAQWTGLLLVAAFFAAALYKFYISNKTSETALDFDSLKQFLLTNLGIYTTFSFLVTYAFMSVYRIEQYLYVVNLVALVFLLGKPAPAFAARGINISKWAINLIFVLAIIGLFTAVAVSSHTDLKTARVRFE